MMPKQPHEVRFEVTVHALVPRDTTVTAAALSNILDGIETTFSEVGGETTINMVRTTKSDPATPPSLPNHGQESYL